MLAAALNTLIQLCITSLLHCVAFIFFVTILSTLRKRSVSAVLKMFVAYWALVTGMANVHNVYWLIYWRPDDNAYKYVCPITAPPAASLRYGRLRVKPYAL